MPLTGNIPDDIAELIRAGHPADQAAAIAYRNANDGFPDLNRSSRIPDINGWFEVRDNPISKIGVFPYSGKSIDHWTNTPTPPDPNRVYQIYRPAEELGAPETVQSFKLTPWTNEHAMLGDPAMDPALTPVEMQVARGTIGEQVYFDDDSGTLFANLKLWSNSLEDVIEAGKKELSCGFRCVYEYNPGVFEGQPFDGIQRTIRANHLATVDHGRMGPGVAVLDHLTFTFDAKEAVAMKKRITRRELFARKLKLTTADPTVMRAALDKALDEEVDDEGGDGDNEMTLSDVSTMLKAIAPQVAEIKTALSALSGDDPAAEPDGDDMEPMMDEYGEPVMETDGVTPKMVKKGANPTPKPKAAAVAPPAVPAADAVKSMDAALWAMDLAMEAIPANLKPKMVAQRAKLFAQRNALAATIARAPTTDRSVAAMDTRLKAAETTLTNFMRGGTKALLGEIAKRDVLAAKVAGFVGTFDHSEMTLGEVATYAADKFGLKVTAGHELTAVESYMTGRVPPSETNVFALDSARGARPAGGKLAEYLKPKAATAA